MPELRDALREATNKLGVLAGNPQLIAFDAMLTSYPTLTVAGAIAFGVNAANAFAGAAATIEVIANGSNVPTFTGITATGSYVNTPGVVNRIEFECLPSGPGSALAFYAQIGNGGGATPVTSVAGKTGAVTLVKADVGLSAVDNTPDADKPVSSAVQSAINGRQPIDSDLTAIAALTDSGLVRRTGAGTADTVAPSASGLTVLTGDSAAARGAIGAETWRYPGSVLVPTLTATGLEQRESDRSVWSNGKIVQCSQLSPRQLNDRRTGYVRNGGCNYPATADANGILRAENWPGVIAYPQKTPSGDYMLLATGSYNYLNTECAEYSYIPAGIGVELVCNVLAKTFVAGNYYLPLVNQYDADKLPVDLHNANIALATASTLSAPLAPGDTTARINKGSAAQWGNGSYRHLLVFPYKNSLGGVYPKPSDPDKDYCYSRYNAFLGVTATVTTTSTEYIITLPSPWAHTNPASGSGGAWPVGTEVAESGGGDANAIYPYGDISYIANQTIESRGIQVGLKSTQKPGIVKLAAGTQFVRVGIAANYGAAGNETLYQMDLYPQ